MGLTWPEPNVSCLEITAPLGKLAFSSSTNPKKLLMLFKVNVGKNSSSPEGAVFSRPCILCSAQFYLKNPTFHNKTGVAEIS